MSGRGSVESLSFASEGSSRAPHRRGPSSGQLSSRSRQPGSRSGDSQSVHSQRQGRGRTADEDYHEFETSSESRGSYSHGSSSQGSGRDDRRRRPAERSRHVATLPARRPKEEQRQRQPRSAQRNPYTQSLRRPNGGRKRGGGDQERRAQSARDLTSTGSRRGRKGKPPSQPRPPPGKAWATIERRANPTVPPADPRTILAEAELHNLPAETMAEARARRRDQRNRRRKKAAEFLTVACRIRPQTEDDKDEQLRTSVRVDDASHEVVLAEGEDPLFGCGPVFEEDATQADIFDNLIVPTLDKALDGFSGTMFVYGQTGSGKTHTMLGPGGRDGGGDAVGIIFRALDHLFASPNNDYVMHLSVLDLYNENLRDLLNLRAQVRIRHVGGRTPKSASKVVLDGATRAPIASRDDAWALVSEARKARVTAHTELSVNSSRSHLIVVVYMRKTDPDGIKSPQITFVDLCGSESSSKLTMRRYKSDPRLSVAQARTQLSRLQTESKNILLSLLALSTIVKELTKPGVSIPRGRFRQSLLTDMLQNSLNGHSLLTFILTISPNFRDIKESRRTLRFADTLVRMRRRTVRKAVVGRSRIQTELDEARMQIHELTKDLTDMRSKYNDLLLLMETDPNQEAFDSFQAEVKEKRDAMDDYQFAVEALERDLSELRHQELGSDDERDTHTASSHHRDSRGGRATTGRAGSRRGRTSGRRRPDGDILEDEVDHLLDGSGAGRRAGGRKGGQQRGGGSRGGDRRGRAAGLSRSLQVANGSGSTSRRTRDRDAGDMSVSLRSDGPPLERGPRRKGRRKPGRVTQPFGAPPAHGSPPGRASRRSQQSHGDGRRSHRSVGSAAAEDHHGDSPRSGAAGDEASASGSTGSGRESRAGSASWISSYSYYYYPYSGDETGEPPVRGRRHRHRRRRSVAEAEARAYDAANAPLGASARSHRSNGGSNGDARSPRSSQQALSPRSSQQALSPRSSQQALSPRSSQGLSPRSGASSSRRSEGGASSGRLDADSDLDDLPGSPDAINVSAHTEGLVDAAVADTHSPRRSHSSRSSDASLDDTTAPSGSASVAALGDSQPSMATMESTDAALNEDASRLRNPDGTALLQRVRRGHRLFDKIQDLLWLVDSAEHDHLFTLKRLWIVNNHALDARYADTLFAFESLRARLAFKGTSNDLIDDRVEDGFAPEPQGPFGTGVRVYTNPIHAAEHCDIHEDIVTLFVTEVALGQTLLYENGEAIPGVDAYNSITVMPRGHAARVARESAARAAAAASGKDEPATRAPRHPETVILFSERQVRPAYVVQCKIRPKANLQRRPVSAYGPSDPRVGGGSSAGVAAPPGPSSANGNAPPNQDAQVEAVVAVVAPPADSGGGGERAGRPPSRDRTDDDAGSRPSSSASETGGNSASDSGEGGPAEGERASRGQENGNGGTVQSSTCVLL